jgi:hypothetical protein
MAIVWIAGIVSISVIAVFFLTRRRVSTVELGTMSNQWVAEKRSSEHSYDR